jgi:lysophospholipase L1-like esterase
MGGIKSFAELAAIHARYNDATRRVAAEVGAPLVDMQQLYLAHGQESLFTVRDVIHPKDTGHALEAEELYRRLQAAGALQQRRP